MTRSKHLQRGFSLVELIVVLSISAVIALYASARVARDSEESLAQGSAQYIGTAAGALQQHLLLNFNNLANGVDVTSTAVDLTPTFAELTALGRFTAGYPNSMPTRQTLTFSIARSNCPGPNCLLVALACTSTPVTLGGTFTRFDLASTMMTAQGGRGGQSLMGGGATIIGPALNIANPMGNVEGIVCGSTQLDTAIYNQFVRMNDTRDPNLQGALSVAGTVTLAGPTTINNSLTVTSSIQAGSLTLGSGGVNCISMNGTTGIASFGCGPTTVVSGAGVTGASLTSTGSISAGTGITSSGGNIVATAGAIAGQTIQANGTFVAGGVCTTGSFGKSANGMLVCLGGTWQPLVVSANAGDACTPNGITALSATNVQLVCVGGVYVGLDKLFPAATTNAACTTQGTMGYSSTQTIHICRANPSDASATLRWMRLQDLVGNLTFVQSLELTHDAKVVKPTCSGASAQPIIQLIPKTESSADGGFARYALNIVEAGVAKWQIRLENGSGTSLTSSTGSAIAIGQVYCYTP